MVFLSYSHSDQSFVDRLSLWLLDHHIKVWRDEYKLSPGDSLTDRIRGAIGQASLLGVVVSDSSLASQWVRHEIEAGLLREKQAVGFSIVPLLTEDVELPELLREHLWVDFRGDFEAGAKRLLTHIERVSRVDRFSGTVEEAAYFNYYATEEAWIEDRSYLELDIVSFDREEKFCMSTSVRIAGNEAATRQQLAARGIDSVKAYVLRACAQAFAGNPARLEIRADKPRRGSFFVTSEDGELRFEARFEVKMLGSHRGETVLFDFGALFGQVCAGAGISVEEPAAHSTEAAAGE